MKKGFILILAIIGFTVVLSSMSMAQISPIDVTTSLPPGTLMAKISKVPAAGGDWVESTDLAFGNLEEAKDPQTGKSLGIYLPKFYFAIDNGWSGGGHVPGKTIAYSYEGDLDFGEHVILSYVKTIIDPNDDKKTQDLLPATSVLLKNGFLVNSDYYANQGWLRVYVGIATGDDASKAIGAKPFTATQAGGTDYKGKIKVDIY